MAAYTHRVACVGETMAMVTPVARTSLAIADVFTATAGGAESNVAGHLARLGLDTMWLSRLGDDALGDRIISALHGHGIDVRWVIRDGSAPTGVYFKDPDPGIRPSVSYYRSSSAASRMSVLDLKRWPIADATWVHTSGITAALSASCSKLVERIIDGADGADGAGYGVSFDVNYRPSLWWTKDLAAARCLELGRRCTVVFVGLDEAQTLWEISTAEEVAELFRGVPTVVVKDGANEAVEFSQGLGRRDTIRVPALAAEVIEPTGAGDAFAAGYLAGYLFGQDSTSRISGGHRLASLTLGSLADYRPLSVEELRATHD